MKLDNTTTGMFAGLAAGILSWCAIVWVIALFVGCVPLITGVKEYKSGDTTIKFLTGFDVGATATGLDAKDDRQGVNAKELKQ